MSRRDGFLIEAGHSFNIGDGYSIAVELLRPRDDDFYGEPRYRFWIVLRNETPILAFEQCEGLAWTPHHDVSFSVTKLYEESRRNLLVTALKLFRKADQV